MLSDSDRKELEFVIAQLRHAYVQLAANTVKKQHYFAEGLIAPQIRKLESMLNRDNGK